MSAPRLALGTVQFGLAYGVAGRDAPVPEGEVRAILARAWELGVRRLDTAPGYGDIEERLARLAGDRDFSIVSKVPGLSAGDDRPARVRASVATSRERLGERLAGLLFHGADDLAGADAERLWAAAAESGLPIGPSCYDAATLQAIAGRFPAGMAQLPGSALDQSVEQLRLPHPVEVTLRSVFLQGLLLLPEAAAVRRVPRAAGAIGAFHRFAAEHGLSPLAAALAVARGLEHVDYCVVGVDSLAQLEEIAAAWEEAPVLRAPQLDTRASDVIDPRRWSKAANA